MTDISRIGVVGGGLMGSGIAQVCAQAGIQTQLCEVDAPAADRARRAIEGSLRKGIERGKVSAEAAADAAAHLQYTTDLGDLSGCDLIIEAIVESLDAKRALWKSLDRIAPAHCIFATNTSSLAVCDQAAVTSRGDRFVGMHFFNPVPAMRLVEVVRTVTTSDATTAAAVGLVRRMGKEAIITRDSPGFVVNLLLVPYMNDAVRAYESGVASVADIDIGMTLGTGVPMGPLALCDYVGLDTMERVGDVMYGALKEARYAAPPLVHRMVVSGWLGRKSGLGFYDYSVSPPRAREIRG